MKVLLRWLEEHVRLPFPGEELPEHLSRLGVEVEDVVDLGEGLRGHVVVGRVLRSRPHPTKSHLRVLEVFVGEETLTLVSAAPNAETGKTFAVALPGARLPGGTVEVRTFDGVVSQGMLLSEAELGLAAHSEGLLELPDSLEPGSSPLAYLQRDDLLLDLYITPNRPDLMGIRGLARELVLVGGELLPVDLSFEEGTDRTLPVEVENFGDCPRYIGRVVEGVTARPSVHWMRYRLALSGIQPRNVLVDVTNYVLLEMGHPLHAFDLARLEEKVVVRRARAGEHLLTLDEVDRELDPETLVIADARKAVALAGVMGGLESSVQPDTTAIFLESALFDPPRVRHAVLRYHLHTESAHRFERGLSFPSVEEASRRALHLYGRLLPGCRIGPPTDVFAEAPEPRRILFSREKFVQVSGLDLAEEELREALSRVADRVDEAPGGLLVQVPLRRVDLALPEDLVEEVLRVVGYDRVPETMEHWGMVGDPRERVPGRLHQILHHYGFTQSFHLEFVSPEDNARFATPPFVTIRNPLGHAFSQLRASLIPSLLRAVSLNLRHGQPWVGLYEIGPTFHPTEPGQLPREVWRLGVVLSGRETRRVHWGTWAPDYTFVKGLLDEIRERFSLELTFEEAPDFLEAGTGFSCGEGRGWMGVLSREVLKAYDIKAPVYALEWELPALSREFRFEPYPQTPAIYRDLSLLVARSARYVEVLEVFRGRPHLIRVELVDVYEGDPLPSDRRSLTFRLVFQHPEATLKDEEVDRVMEALMRDCEARGFQIRGR